MESLEWSECNETLDDILQNPRVQLPQLIKLSSPLCDIKTNECIEKDQIVVIHSKETIDKVQGATNDGKTINIPIGCPHKTRRRVSPGKEKVFDSIKDLAKAEPLPRFVEVKEVEGIENVANGDRLKVVIVEKTGGVPAFIHFRSSNGKHVKMSVDEKISFQSSVSDGSDQNIAKLAEKSREFPISAEFQKKDVPKSHTDLGVFTINRCSEDIVVIASAKKSTKDYAIVFPLDTEFKFQVSSKLKMAKDETYRQLCQNSFTINPDDIKKYLNHASPTDSATRYVLTYKKLQKILKFDYSDDTPSPKQKMKVSKKDKKEQSKKEKEPLRKESEPVKKETKEPIENSKECQKPPDEDRKDSPVSNGNDEDVNALPPNTLVEDAEQKEILKKEIKERERQAKLEKEQLKAEKKKEKKLRKEKEKEEKKKKKLSTSSISNPSSPTEIQSDDLYVVPQDEKRVSPSPSNQSSDPSDEQQSQLTMHLMNTFRKVRDRTQSLGFRNKKKRGKLRKEDIQYISSDPIAPEPDEQDSYYAGLDDDAFSESLYEALPGEMAYESLDLVAQVQRSLAPQPSNENSGDSGFDEIDQARIQAWRDSMAPPPLPGNHPLQHSVSQPQEDNLYETAVDCRGAMPAAWQSFYNSVEQSTKEISSWDMEDVASCLTDILLENYVEVFSDSQVDGQLLLDLDESVLRDLGLNPFEARKLRKFVFGWRPDVIRPQTYPNRIGFESDDPSQWSQEDTVKHLKVIEINDFADFCEKNQVNGELLKDICVDETIMNSIITTRDKKLKTVKIKNYVIDKWRPKKKGEGNYMSSISILPPEKRGISSPNMNKSGNTSPSTMSPKRTSPTITRDENTSPKSVYQKNTTRKVSDGTTPGINRKVTTGDMPLIAKMKQQLEENKNAWEKRK